MQPTLIINRHRHTGIIVGVRGQNLLVIKLGKRKLTVSSICLETISIQGYIINNYSPKLAEQAYFQHGAGVSERGREYLEKITRAHFSDSLIFF